MYVPGDPKGEWGAVADAVGGTVLRLGLGRHERLNPLDLVVCRRRNGAAQRPLVRGIV